VGVIEKWYAEVGPTAEGGGSDGGESPESGEEG
jgi:hypothetical protein